MVGRNALTLNLTEKESAVLEELAKRKGLTKTAVLRQALRLYQMIDVRMERGERIVLQDDLRKASTDLIVL